MGYSRSLFALAAILFLHSVAVDGAYISLSTPRPTTVNGGSNGNGNMSTAATGQPGDTTPNPGMMTTTIPQVTTSYILPRRPSPAPGAPSPNDFPYTTTNDRPNNNYSGISYSQLDAAQAAWNMLLVNAAAAGAVPLNEASKVFAMQAVYTMLVWHPEYNGAFGVSNAEEVWTNADLDDSFQQLGWEIEYEFTNLTGNNTAQVSKLLDDAAFARWMLTRGAHNGKVWFTLPFFCWLVDGELAAVEFFLGNALTDEAYAAFGSIFDFLNLRSYHDYFLYGRQCNIRPFATDFARV